MNNKIKLKNIADKILRRMENNVPKSKTFVTIDSLWYEEERLATFIDWPVKFLLPANLASNGFYYLRSEDHCACAFCRGIIGAWEEGDTPEGEHKRHFPTCPFVCGLPTPNVPILHGKIIAKYSKGHSSKAICVAEDVCGNGITKIEKSDSEPTIFLPNGKVPVSVPLSSMGLPSYNPPARKTFISYESRLQTFKRWPNRVQQTPEELADAGFFYCGVSDHVRCFHCGNGLRNWEVDDDPWSEHARWYPECHYILLKKGIEFVDKVRRERPPYFQVQNTSKSSKANTFKISDEEMDRLMELHVMKAVLDMGFAKSVVKSVLLKKLQQTGLPFFSTEPCIEAILQYNDSSLNSESVDVQERKLQTIQSSQPQSDDSSANTDIQERQLQISQPPPEDSPVNSESVNIQERQLQAIQTSQPQTEDSSVNSETASVQECSSPQPQSEDSSVNSENVEILEGKLEAIQSSPLRSGESSPTPDAEDNLAEELEKLRECRMCKVCMDKEMDIVFLPCTHMVACSSCAVVLTVCPICRRGIQYAFKPIIS